MENYSLADIAAATGENGFGGNSWVLIILFALIFGNGFGFGGNKGTGDFATSASQSEILIGQQFQNLDNKIDRLGNGIADATFSLNNSIHGSQDFVGGAVVNEGRSIQMQIADCCCKNQSNVDSLRFDMSNYAASIQANDTANTQKILDAICQSKIDALQAKVNQLEMTNAINSATAGVVKYPMLTTYSSGVNPFCSNGCNC